MRPKLWIYFNRITDVERLNCIVFVRTKFTVNEEVDSLWREFNVLFALNNKQTTVFYIHVKTVTEFTYIQERLFYIRSLQDENVLPPRDRNGNECV